MAFCSIWWQFCSFQIVWNPFSSFKQFSCPAVLAFGCWSHQSLDFCYFPPLWWFSSVLLFSLASTFISTVYSAMVLSIHLRESSHSALWRKGHSLTSVAWLPQWVVHDLFLSSCNCGGSSLGNHFGDRLRIAISFLSASSVSSHFQLRCSGFCYGRYFYKWLRLWSLRMKKGRPPHFHLMDFPQITIYCLFLECDQMIRTLNRNETLRTVFLGLLVSYLKLYMSFTS